MRYSKTKSSFVFPYDFQKSFEVLSDEDAGKLIKAILDYEINKKGPDFVPGSILAIIFETNVKIFLDKMQRRYDQICEKNRENGKSGGRPKTKTTKAQKQTVSEEKPKKSIRLLNNPNNPSGFLKTHGTTTESEQEYEQELEQEYEYDKPSINSTTVVIDTTACAQPVDNPTHHNEDFKSVAQMLDGWNLSQKTKPIKPEELVDDYDPNLNSSAAFSRFWQNYPRKQGELEAKIAWAEATGEKDVIPGDLIRAAAKFAKSQSDTETKYIPMPANFIRKLMWREFMPKALPCCTKCSGKGFTPSKTDNDTLMICDCCNRYYTMKGWTADDFKLG